MAIRWLLVALLVPCALAQTPEEDRRREYNRQQEQQREEQQRRAQEEFARQEKRTADERKKQQDMRDEVDARSDASRQRSQAAPNATSPAENKAMRAKLLAMPALPDGRNPLLGRWRVEGSAKPQRKDDLGKLMGMLADPGGAGCHFMFGSGITEFKPKSWASIDGHGDDSLGPIAYRGDAKRVWAIPAADVFAPLGFDVADGNRAVSVNLGGCALVRVAAAATTSVPSPQSAAATATRPAVPPASGAVVDGAAFRCGDGRLLHVSLCQGESADAPCKLTELHKPGLQIGQLTRRADIAARVKGCEAGGIRYGADDRPVFVR